MSIKTLDTLTERITLDQFGNLEILPRHRKQTGSEKRWEDATRPIRLTQETVKKLKEILGLFLLLLPWVLWSAPIVWVEKGMNVHRVWNADGLMISQQQQKLTQRTNLSECYFTASSVSPTQTAGVRLYQGHSGPLWLVWASSMTWDNGVVTSNWQTGDGMQWTTFTTGGSVGAGVFASDGERHQLVNCAVFSAFWKTNTDFFFACENNDDKATVVWWYRSGSVTNGLPWFIPCHASLAPGERKLVKPPVPVDVLWHHMGTDKCYSCGAPCWLPSWPRPEGLSMALSATPSGSVSFRGAPFSSYAVDSTADGKTWRPATVVLTDGEGRGSFVMGNQSPRFYRTRLLASSTMTEKEASLALKDLLEFEDEQ